MAFSFRLKLQQKSELSQEMRRLAQKKEALKQRREYWQPIAEGAPSLPPKQGDKTEAYTDPNVLPPIPSTKRLQEQRLHIAIVNQAPHNLKREITRNTLVFTLLFIAVSACCVWALKLLEVI